ncbi:MAG: ADP-heptose--lipooligosaccharide heptosyltransferase II [Candidatus Ozemobacter sibiricus]|uniref:ADP-heptose--lipooligosaccharide heptosyltransferase II n=1 Tax=Candidatus Ozemobacter sibiricus TaxID=2268124 RepID=A0A367ZPT0_9BACT|nr:MAG: ADP-heptose--lipooligosaccharide heptosyltransferase II [Candidatus Ozemobacter sibiricus]
MPPEILLRFTALGDILLAVPAARALLRRGIDLHWVIHRRWAPLAPWLPATVHLLGGMGDLLPLARRLRTWRPGRVHDLQGKPLSLALGWLLGAPVTRYAKRPWAEQWAAMRGGYPLRGGDPRPVWQRYLATIGEPAAPPDGRLVMPASCSPRVDAFLHEHGLASGAFVLIHPGAAHPGKVLPPAALAAVPAIWPRLAAIGDRADLSLPAGVVDLRGRLPLDLLPGVMAHARGVVSTDSGPMHLARAVGVPVVGIFLQTDPSLGFSPLPGAAVRIISRDLPCKPCSLHGQRATCPEGHWACRDLDWGTIAADLRRWFDHLAQATPPSAAAEEGPTRWRAADPPAGMRQGMSAAPPGRPAPSVWEPPASHVPTGVRQAP